MKIGIVDDHQLVRDSFKQLLELQTNWQVTIEANTIDEAKFALALEQPDVFIVDISLGCDQTGLTFLTYLKTSFPEVKALVVSMYDNDPYVSNAFRNGALGYVSKRAAADELLSAILAITEGRQYMSSDVKLSGQTSSHHVAELLTHREREALPLFAKGMNAKQVAQVLNMMPKTAHVHKANIYSKLNVTTSFELLKVAIEIGAIQLDELT